MADTENLGLYIKVKNEYIPFKSYMKNDANGDEYYYYLKNDDIKKKLINRWAVMNFCGKKIIANKQTEEDGLEVTPNDIVAFPYKPSYKRLSFLFILFFLMGTIVWATRFTHISDVFTVSAFNEFFRVGLVVWILYVMLLLVCFVKSNEAKNEAKEWNSIIVPEERLK